MELSVGSRARSLTTRAAIRQLRTQRPLGGGGCISLAQDLAVSLQGLRKGEDDDRWRARTAEEGRNRAGGRGGILLSVERVGDHAAADAAAGVEAVEHLSGVCVQRKEVVVEIAGEQHPAGGRRHAGNERRG